MFDHLPRPLLFAHRGASAKAPENTMHAFQLARDTGADVLELDVHLTADGQVVVFHDPTLERTTDGQGPIAQKTYTELLGLDAGYRFRSSDGAYVFRERGVQIPLLAEVIASFGDAGFNLELKVESDALLSSTLKILDSLRPEQLVLAAGNQATMAKLEAADTGFPLGMSYEGIREVLKRVWTGRSIRSSLAGRALQIPPWHGWLPIATGPVIRAAHQAGLEVHLWTINSRQEAEQWLRRGVDGIMSDDPGALASAFAAADSVAEAEAAAR